MRAFFGETWLNLSPIDTVNMEENWSSFGMIAGGTLRLLPCIYRLYILCLCNRGVTETDFNVSDLVGTNRMKFQDATLAETCQLLILLKLRISEKSKRLPSI